MKPRTFTNKNKDRDARPQQDGKTTDSQEHKQMPTNTSGERKTSQKGSRLRGDGNAEGEAPRADSYHNKRPPGAGPTPAGGSSGVEARSTIKHTKQAKTPDNQKLAEKAKNR